MRLSLYNKILGAFSGGLILISIVYMLSFKSSQDLIHAFRQVTQSQKLLYRLETLFSLLKDVQRAHRGYILSGDEEFLAPYHSARSQFSPLLDSLDKDLAGRNIQKLKLDSLERLVIQKLAYVDTTLSNFRKGNTQLVMANVDQGKKLMDQTGLIINFMQQRENQRLLTLSSQAYQNATHNTFVIITSVCCTALLFSLALVRIAKDIRNRNKLQNQVVDANNELTTVNEELKTSNENLNSVNTELVALNHTLQINQQQLLNTQHELEKRETQLLESQALTHTGSFNWDMKEDIITYSPEYALIFQVDTTKPHQIQDFIAILHPDDKENVSRSIQQSLNEKKPIDIEYRVILNNAVHYITSKGRVLEQDGKPIYIRGTVVDITERKKAEQELISSEARFRALLDSAPDAMIIVNEKGEITLVNNQMQKIFGYTKQEILGLKIEKLIPQKYAAKHLEDRTMYTFMPKVRAMGVGLELNAIKKDGQAFPVEISLSPISTSEGLLIAAAVRDITERKLLDEKLQQYTQAIEEGNRQLQQTNQDLEAFSYSVSHDLKSPLRSIISFAGILGDEYQEQLDSEAHRLLSVVQQNAYYMNNLIEALLNFSRLGKTAVLKEEVNMQKLVSDIIVEQLKTIQRESNPKIEIESLCFSWADYHLIKQVWLNLLTNAIKFSSQKEDACIHIGCLPDEKEDIYFVKDNGIGFNVKYMGELFGVFKRLHSSKEFTGTGVGLAICHRIITNHGGRIWAEAQENVGATFYFSLPKK